MPVLDGFELITKSRELYENKGKKLPPVLMLSAFSEGFFSAEKFDKHQIDYFVQKPPQKDNLMRVFKSLNLSK